MANVREPRELTLARAALARASRAHPNDDEHPDVVAARSAYVLEQARAALAGILDRADDLDRDDARTLAAELRDLAREIRPGR